MSIFTQEDLNILIPMFSVAVFALSLIALMSHQETKRRALYDKMTREEKMRAQKSHF